jgi:hypothetical protein
MAWAQDKGGGAELHRAAPDRPEQPPKSQGALRSVASRADARSSTMALCATESPLASRPQGGYDL